MLLGAYNEGNQHEIQYFLSLSFWSHLNWMLRSCGNK